MMSPRLLKIFTYTFFTYICTLATSLAGFIPSALAEKINFTFLQLNDIYEITPIAGGKQGGMARVATIRQQLLRENPLTYTILAGDAFSPSALGTAKINDQPLAGQQMVAVMNAVGFDFATFGNHEFDLPESLFLKRLEESEFTWFSGNVSDRLGKPFPKVPRFVILEIPGETEGKTVKVGFIGLTIPNNLAEYVSYKEPIATVEKQVQQLKNQVDVIVLVSHLDMDMDRAIAENIPEIDLILGGHEHENIQQWRGFDFTPIFKADANARTVYIHHLTYDTEEKKLTINSRLQPITDSIPDHPATAQVVQTWLEKGFAAFQAKGFQPSAIIGQITTTLDGLEASVRNRSTNLTELIGRALLSEVAGANLAIHNSGGIRIDDQLTPGNITQYDVLRIWPFGGNVLEVSMSGELLREIFQKNLANRGKGNFLQMINVSQNTDGTNWLINGQPLSPTKIYRVAINDYTVSGKLEGFTFLTPDHPGLKVIQEKNDVRQAIIRQIQREQKN